MPLGTLLVVEDDSAIRRGLCDALKFNGYLVREADDGRAGLDAAMADGIDLVLLDILMPRMDGLQVLAELRKARPSLPVIFLTARGQEEDRVKGLKSGADDYIVKPFSLGELMARVEAVLRRLPERPTGVAMLIIAGRRIDFERREIIHDDGSPESLSQREGEVLAYLASNRGRAIAREELLSRVWGVDPRGVTTRTVDMAIARLRTQLRDDPDDPKVILTVRGKGYMFAPAPTSPASPAPPHVRGGSP
jgi:two-component system, OmpR family, alkaline phosphatase synthesis response regulator PhoP